jgi:hypothetical protein
MTALAISRRAAATLPAMPTPRLRGYLDQGHGAIVDPEAASGGVVAARRHSLITSDQS